MSTLIIGDKQILPEKPEVVTGYTVNTTAIPTASANRFFIYKCGNTVQLQMDAAAGNCNIAGATQTTVISGLPRALNLIDLQITVDNPSVYARAWISGTGTLDVFINPAYTGSIFIGGVYITTD